MAYHATQAVLHCTNSHGQYQQPTHLAVAKLCRCVQTSRSAGRSSITAEHPLLLVLNKQIIIVVLSDYTSSSSAGVVCCDSNTWAHAITDINQARNQKTSTQARIAEGGQSEHVRASGATAVVSGVKGVKGVKLGVSGELKKSLSKLCQSAHHTHSEDVINASAQIQQ
eukprot:4474-Heterococcus_DN1.PRE.5